ncbi:MAG: ribosomal protein S18-alanine N-acetyltransferase [Burkholderiales bacterium]
MSASITSAHTPSVATDAAPCFRRMTESDLDAVMAIEAVVYTHPWTHGNFSDSMAAQSHCFVMEWHGTICGYAVLTTGADEAHLLNLSISASWQRRGLGRELLDHVMGKAREMKVQKIFLEVRTSNAAARALYAHSRFREIGVRRAYYPAHTGREDAIVLECIVGNGS